MFAFNLAHGTSDSSFKISHYFIGIHSVLYILHFEVFGNSRIKIPIKGLKETIESFFMFLELKLIYFILNIQIKMTEKTR